MGAAETTAPYFVRPVQVEKALQECKNTVEQLDQSKVKEVRIVYSLIGACVPIPFAVE